MVDRVRLEPKVRKNEILQAALAVAAKEGYASMTREQVANKAGCSQALVSNYYGTMTQLRRSVLRHAIKNEHHHVIAQALIAGDRLVKGIPRKLKVAVLESI